MSRLGKISFIFAAITLLCFAIAKFLISYWIPFFWVLIGLFVVFVATGLIVDRKFFAEFFTMKTTKHGMNMGVLIFGFIALVVIVNILGARHYKTWDFSQGGINTLSDQSIKLVKDLKDELTIVYLYKKNSRNYEVNRRMFTELIRKYQDQSSKIVLEFYEADARPDMAEKYQFKGEQAVYLDYRGKRNRVDKIDEQEITSALVKVTREKSKNVYFTTGHGEPDIESQEDAEALGHLKQLLEGNNYTVKSINLASAGTMPEDMDVLVIANPQFAFQKIEIQALEAFLKNGGNMMVSLAYPDKSGLKEFLSKLGVEVQDQFVMNVINSPVGAIVDPSGPTKGSRFSPDHPVTKVFSKSEGILFIKPLALKKASKIPDGLNVEEMIGSPASISFSDAAMRSQGPVADYTLVMSVRGPHPEATDKTKTFNLIVSGDTHFMENQLLYAFVNRDLVLNSVAMLAKEENLISITPKEPVGTKMELTTAKEAVLLWGIFLPVPILFFASSLYFWIRRRHA